MSEEVGSRWRSRLIDHAAKAGFTMSDLSRWIEVSTSTIYEWVRNGRNPSFARGVDIEVSLRQLREAIAAGKLPLSPLVVGTDRAEQIESIKNEYYKLS